MAGPRQIILGNPWPKGRGPMEWGSKFDIRGWDPRFHLDFGCCQKVTRVVKQALQRTGALREWEDVRNESAWAMIVKREREVTLQIWVWNSTWKGMCTCKKRIIQGLGRIEGEFDFYTRCRGLPSPKPFYQALSKREDREVTRGQLPAWLGRAGVVKVEGTLGSSLIIFRKT